MSFRVRHWVLLGASIVLFALVMSLITVAVLRLRRDRDLVFGLEQLDALIAEERLSEAAAMVPWLAERADEALEMLSVLKRGVALLERTGDSRALDHAAQTAVSAFPGNRGIRVIAIYAAVRAGDLERALEWSREHLSRSQDGALFAWVMLQSGVAAQPPPPEDGDGFLMLASLARTSRARDFERAWLLTGDWRYAADGAVLAMQAGDGTLAEQLALGASLSLRAPVLAADVFADRGEHEAALDALSGVRAATPATRLRMADALMRLGRAPEAEAIYRAVLSDAPGGSAVPYVNLALVETDPARALALYDQAVQRFPRSWATVRERALFLAQTDDARARASLEEYTGPLADPRRTLLLLQLEPRPGRRGYDAALWELLNARDAPEEAYRFAAWYFASRAAWGQLSEVLERSTSDGTWAQEYAGLLAAVAGEWQEAAAALTRAYERRPTWRTALNAALAELRGGEPQRVGALLDDAERRARLAGLPPGSSAVFVAVARTTSDPKAAREAVATALRVDPTSTAAVLLRSQLESGRGY